MSDYQEDMPPEEEENHEPTHQEVKNEPTPPKKEAAQPKEETLSPWEAMQKEEERVKKEGEQIKLKKEQLLNDAWEKINQIEKLVKDISNFNQRLKKVEKALSDQFGAETETYKLLYDEKHKEANNLRERIEDLDYEKQIELLKRDKQHIQENNGFISNLITTMTDEHTVHQKIPDIIKDLQEKHGKIDEALRNTVNNIKTLETDYEKHKAERARKKQEEESARQEAEALKNAGNHTHATPQ